ncbi:MAG: hypothetical protein GY828_03925 [Candidatus Gracilibacteria bacterium]|nr:hypothetical protein [Candidatus Gracilibacteria bacterium]
MVEFSLNTYAIEKSIDESLSITSNLLVAKVRENTPRDKKRLPKNTINRKDGKKPFRSSHYKPVQINGNWYEGVTGNLKRSISMEKLSNTNYAVGIIKGPTEEYGKHLEFGTDVMEERSFLRKGLVDNKKYLTKVMKNNFNILLKKNSHDTN